jgi:drug/metabolite transporter (DMT)-like permease
MFSIGSWGAIWLYWEGIKQMDPSLAAFVNRTEVPVAIILGMIFLRERFTRWEAVGTLTAIAGIVMMKLTLRFEYSTGFWLVLIGAVLFGITEFVSKIAVRHVEPSILAYIRNMFVAAFYWISVYAGGVSFDGMESVWPGVLVLGVVGPILARLPYLWALKKLELSKVAVISQSQPVYVILLSLLLLSQLPTFREITGGIFLTVGCVILVLSRQRSRPSAAGGC